MAKDTRFDPRWLDLQAFAGAAARLGGAWPQDEFKRLGDSLMALPGDLVPAPVAWSATGALRPVAGGASEVWLQLQADCRVTLQCQRCLQPMAEAVQIDRWFRFAPTEDEAARLDEESEDDVLVLSPRFDLHGLLEDELILALPIVPMHETCPEPLPAAMTDEIAEEPAPHPFAALAALRRPPRLD
jgi:uncharacterized protein